MPKIAGIVRGNRRGGPERVVDVVSGRAPEGFTRCWTDVIACEERAAIAGGHVRMAGFAAPR